MASIIFFQAFSGAQVVKIKERERALPESPLVAFWDMYYPQMSLFSSVSPPVSH
jgi:hypothetical protein